ncbi:hypothetical protein [Calditerrivibrio nitroreducens]|uniref:Uncharacterized protein n=1 Tax=Calditerrivibrio nitroreducens (strain DSM 19672 / NBRC 101217 / Yu37-1) TaxID=768670 RepID=E4TET3_CALNY|nr:hypothetical protein [Calditerrivibrio nitroreducens]ADR18339.1 hypothetical protein Calni_0426 [Calditerrivibrio nitroreducens DSM 19672]
MNENEIIEKVLKDIDKLFPKKCSCCGVVFENFLDFIEKTDIPVHAFDANFMVMHLHNVYDILALRNCKCKTTIALPCAIDPEFKKEIVLFLENEAKKLNIPTEKMAGLLRDKIIKIARDRSE